MSTEENKTIARRFLQLVAEGNVDGIQEIVAPNWVNHDPSLPPMQGHEGAKQLVNLFNSAFSNLHLEIEDLLAEGDKVAGRFLFSGANTGSFQGMPPTGKTVKFSGTGIFRVVGGKVTDNWVNFDALGMLQQLGAVPTPGQPPS